MNSIWIVVAIALWFFLGYKIYGRYIEKKMKPSNRIKTPAVTSKNKIDYSPSNKPFLIGHHFASIAGAGPIIGPILAVSYFGWLAVVIWIAVGSVFIGAMHDYVTLMASVRNKAKGVSSIAKDILNSRAGWIFGLMIWITLVLIISVFSVSSAESIVNKPDLVIPLIAVSIIAFILGLGIQKWKWNYKIATFTSVILVFSFIGVGYYYPISLPFDNPLVVKNIWITLIMLYAALASVLPVWIFLRPRDYLSAIQMSIILLMGFIGILFVRPEINAPMYVKSGFPLWPILFITVACGAISGFHGLVSSGTTSKQLARESDGKAVGYGSMLGEAVLAILVTTVAIAGLKWGVGEGTFQNALNQGWVVLFSEGFGNIVGGVGIPLISAGIAGLLGAIMVNQFILTTVDTSTRIGRFVFSESLFTKMKNRFITTAIILIPAWLLAITNSYQTIWKLFGASNQLIASISLITVSAYFVARKTKVKFIIIPALFVLITTLSALLYMAFNSSGYFIQKNWILFIISIGMFILGVVVALEGFKVLRKKA